MAPLVDHKTANCRGRKQKEGSWKRWREMFEGKERQREVETDRKRRERVTWLKYNALLSTDVQTAESDKALIILRGIEERLMSGLGSLSCVQMASPACRLTALIGQYGATSSLI